MFNDQERELLVRMLKRELGSIDGFVALDPVSAEKSKTQLKGLLEKVKDDSPIIQPCDILALDEEIDFDEILLAKNGDPIARMRVNTKRKS